MKAFIATVMLLLAAAALASAQDASYPPRGMEYGFVGAGMGLNAGLGVEVRVVNGFGVGTELGGIGLAAKDDNKTTGLWSVNPVYHYFPRNPRVKVAPFFAGGLSEFFGHNTHTEFGGGGAYHTFGFNVGGGLDVFATRHTGLRLDLRYYGHGGRILNWVYPDVEQFSFVAVRVAVTFR
jgi:hypothetical protein